MNVLILDKRSEEDGRPRTALPFELEFRLKLQGSLAYCVRGMFAGLFQDGAVERSTSRQSAEGVVQHAHAKPI